MYYSTYWLVFFTSTLSINTFLGVLVLLLLRLIHWYYVSWYQILQCTPCLPREEMSMACLRTARLLQFSLAALRGWIKVMHGTTSHSGHSPGHAKTPCLFFTLHACACLLFGVFFPSKTKQKTNNQTPHQGSGEDHMQLGVILTWKCGWVRVRFMDQ